MPALRLIVVVAALLMMASACGEDEGARVRQIGEESPGTTGTGTGAGTGTGTGTGTSATGTTATGTEAPKCEPVGDSSGAATSIDVTLEEWKVIPQVAEAPPGRITFKLRNAGKEPHEMVIVRADSAQTLPVDKDGAFDEGAAPPGSVIGEVEAFPAGDTCEGTFDLTPARYVLLCNLVEREGDRVESHFKEGMSTEFSVR